MSLYDDMFEMDRHFKKLRSIVSVHHEENKRLAEAWERISNSHADMERTEMKTEPVIRAISTILAAFEVNRGYEE